MPLKQLILHTVRHLETITAISSLIGISSKVLLSGRWQKKKKKPECTTWPFFTCLLKHLGSLKNWHIPRLQPKDWSLLRMSILYSHPNEWASAKKQTLHWWGKTSQFHISGLEGQDGKDNSWGHTKKILFHLFSQVKSKGLPNCLDTNMHLPKQNTASLPSLEHSDG